MIRFIAADAVDNLGNLVETQRLRSAGVIQPGQRTRQDPLADSVEAVGIRGRADFVVIQGRGLAFLEAGLDPVDRAGVAVEADAHGQ